MKKIIVFCFLLVLYSEEQASAFITALSNQKFVVHFDLGASALNMKTRSQLDTVASFLYSKKAEIQKIEIKGFCDSVGGNIYNDVLSENRAQSVKLYLVSKGIGVSLISSARGYGKALPLAGNRTESGREENRRVEILVHLNVPVKSEGKTVDTVKLHPVNPSDSSTLPTIDLSHAQVNDIIAVQDINFYPDRHMIVASSLNALHTLLNTMRVNKTLRIEIRGHVCCTPGYQGDAMDIDTYTEDLSLQRAKEIYLYLSENGIAKDRMTYIGLGGKYPLVKEFTERDKATNRRVEIKILSK